jgi:hypothetical protein
MADRAIRALARKWSRVAELPAITDAGDFHCGHPCPESSAMDRSFQTTSLSQTVAAPSDFHRMTPLTALFAIGRSNSL